MTSPLRVTVWNEFRHEREKPEVRAIYPDGLHATIADALACSDVAVRTATLDEPEHGLTADVLAETDVLTWWGHAAHEEVSDAVVERVVERVWQGMGLLVLHSGHHAKVFRRLMGTTGNLRWREDGEREVLWVVEPSHPIVQGLGPCIVLPQTEMYGEFFDIPAPDELLFVSNFAGGEVFRSGCCWRRGSGRIFYFRPGHETYPIYHDERIRLVLRNAVRWAAPQSHRALECPHSPRDWFLTPDSAAP